MDDPKSMELNANALTVPLVVAITTFCLLLVHLVARISCGRDSPDIVMFYDEANALTYRYQYIVRLLYGPKSLSFADSTTTIFGEVEHSINRIVKIPFSPATMERVYQYKGHRCAKVFIRTGERYSNISKLLMYHNGRGSIIIVALELQEVDAENSIASVLNNPIFSASSGRAAKVTAYPFGREQPTPLEDDIRPTRNVTLAEAIYLLYTSVNAVYLVGLLLLEKSCTDDTFCDYDTGLLFGSVAGAVGFLLFLLTASFCRFVVRSLVYRSLGRGCSKGFRVLYLSLVAAAGITLGAFCAQRSMTGDYYGGKINEHAQLLSAAAIWTMVSGVGVFTMLILVGLSLPLAVYFRFIVLVGDDAGGDGKRGSAAVGLLKRFAGGGRKRGGRGDTISAEDSITVKSTTVEKFRSEEAFNAAQSFAETSTYDTGESGELKGRHKRKPLSPSTTEGTASPGRGGKSSRGADHGGRGRGGTDNQRKKRKGKTPKQDDAAYANFLAHEQKVVRSISQYESDDGASAVPIIPATPLPKVAGGGKGGKSRRKDDCPKSETIEGPNNSSGYGRHLLKVGGKVKSVSQYEFHGKAAKKVSNRPS